MIKNLLILTLIAVAIVTSVAITASLDTISANERAGSPITFQHDTSVKELQRGQSITVPINVRASDAANVKIFVSEAFDYPNEFTDWETNADKFGAGITASLNTKELRMVSGNSETVNVTIIANEDAKAEKRVIAVTLFEAGPPKRFSQFYIIVDIK